MEINLLPRRSPLEKYRQLLIIGITLFLLSGLSGVVLAYLNLTEQIRLTTAELERTKSDVVVLIAERTERLETTDFNKYRAQADELLQQEQEYGQMLDRIAAQLSEQTIVISAYLKADKQEIGLTLQSESMDAIADYAELLRSEPWVQEVTVQTITNVKEADKLSSTDVIGDVSVQPYTANVVIHVKAKPKAEQNAATKTN